MFEPYSISFDRENYLSDSSFKEAVASQIFILLNAHYQVNVIQCMGEIIAVFYWHEDSELNEGTMMWLSWDEAERVMDNRVDKS